MFQGAFGCLRVIGGVAALSCTSAVYAQLSFEETSGPAGLTHSGESFGASWGDLNGDGYPDLYVDNHRKWASLYRNNADGTFTNVILTADGSGVWKARPGQDNHGGAWADFDGDGDQDLYATDSAGSTRGKLLVNEGGILTDRARGYGVWFNGGARLPIWFDYNRDGDLDIAFMTIKTQSLLYERRNGAGTGFNYAFGSGFDCESMDYAQLSDVTGDGVMDLICANGSFPRKVYDISQYPFRDITSIMPSVRRTTDSVIADFDGDLDPDVFVLSGRKHPAGIGLASSTVLEASVPVERGDENGIAFVTSGKVSFELNAKAELNNPGEVYIGASGRHPASIPFTLDPAGPAVHGAYAHDPASSSGVFIGYDPASHRWEVLVAGLDDHAASAYLAIESTAAITDPRMLRLDPEDQPWAPSLLINTGGRFVAAGASHGLSEPVQCVSAVAGDFDNDMDADVYAVCRGGVENLPNRLYENLGNGTFALVQGEHGAEGVQGFHLADKAGIGDSVVVADYDVDGCLDLFVTNGMPLRPLRHDSGPDQLFRNRCDTRNNWIQLDLRGHGFGASNPDGIGATVYVTAGGITQMREQNGGYHRWSQDHQRLHFGLAANTTVDEIRVMWPSGAVDTYHNVSAGQVYQVRERQTAVTPVVFGGGEFPAPQPGDECGTPRFDAKIHAGIFLWKDCSTGVWSVQASAGGRATNVIYDGGASSDAPFDLITPVSMEGADFARSDSNGQLLFNLRMKQGGIDGFQFRPANGASVCFNPTMPAGTQLLLGAGSRPAPIPLELRTFERCVPPAEPISACGRPQLDSANEAGVFVWQDCPSDSWRVRVTAGGGAKVVYQGQLRNEQPLPSAPVPFSVEANDAVDAIDAHTIAYRLNVQDVATDGFDFEAAAAGQSCFSVDLPAGIPVYAGANKYPLGTSFDLSTLAACSPSP